MLALGELARGVLLNVGKVYKKYPERKQKNNTSSASMHFQQKRYNRTTMNTVLYQVVGVGQVNGVLLGSREKSRDVSSLNCG